MFDQRCLTRLEVRYNRPSLSLVQDLPCTAFHLIARVDGLLYKAAFLGLSTLSEQLTEGGNYHRETLKNLTCMNAKVDHARRHVWRREQLREHLFFFCLAISILPLLLFPSHTTLFLPTFNFFPFSSTSKPPTAVATTTASPSTTRSSTKPK